MCHSWKQRWLSRRRGCACVCSFPSPRTVGDSSPSPRTHPPHSAHTHSHSQPCTHSLHMCLWLCPCLSLLVAQGGSAPCAHTCVSHPLTARHSLWPGTVRAVLRGSSQTGGVRAGDEPGLCLEGSRDPRVPSRSTACARPAGPLRPLHRHSG